MKIIFIIVLHGIALLTTEAATPYCNPNPTTPPVNAPQLPTLPPSFQTRVEANLKEMGYTLEVSEYADDTNNQAAMTVIRNGDLTQLVYDYKTKQIYIVHDDVCTTRLMAKDTRDMYLFGDELLNGVTHVFSTNEIIKFAKRFGERYLGQKAVRGIWTDHWQSCMYWGYYKANFTLDYYFSALNWTASMDYPQVPVRAEVIGIMQTTSGTKNFHHIYDYYDFRPGIEPGTTAFETPPNVVCPNRKSVKLIPKVAKQFYFRSEETILSSGNTLNLQVWYDQEYNIVRSDYGLHHPIVHIEDFNRGIRYEIDKMTDACTISSLPNDTTAGKRVGPGNQWVMEMLSPLEFLQLDQNFVYVGQRTVRGIVCDLFVSVFNANTTGSFSTPPTVAAYFSRDKETPDTGTSGDPDVYQHVLVQMEIYVNKTFNNIISYYDFDFSHSNPESTFDTLSSCFADTDKLGFRIKFPVDYPSDLVKLMKYRVEVQHQVLSQLSVSLQIDPIRIQHLQVHADSNNMYVTGTLLQRSPLMDRYYKIPNQSIELVTYQFQDTTAGVDCVTYCDNAIDCMSFALCTNNTDTSTSTCYVSDHSQQFDPQTDQPLSVPYCNRFSAIVKEPEELPDRSLAQAWVQLKDNVYGGYFIFNVQQPTFNPSLKASEIIQDDIWKKDSTDFLQSVFLLQQATMLKTPTLKLPMTAFDDCARYCVSNDTCKAFSFCLSDVTCLVLDRRPTNDDMKHLSQCYLYEVKLPPTTPTTQPATSDMPIETTAASSKEPFITSSNGSPVPTKSTDFILYKKDADFTDVSGTEIAKSVEECMEYCIQDSQCQTITICERESKCHLSDLQPDTSHLNLVRQRFGCDIYTLSGGGVSPPQTRSTSRRALTTDSKTTIPIPATFVPVSTTFNPPTTTPAVLPIPGVAGYMLMAESTLAGVVQVSKPLVSSAAQCGQYCDNRTDVHCRGFQFCPAKQMCNLLPSRHLPPPRVLKFQTICQFYTREFLVDFAKQDKPPKGDQQFTPVKNIDIHSCAELCGLDPSSCSSFQICPQTMECLLETRDKSISYADQSQTGCQYYKSQRNVTTDGTERLQGSKKNIGLLAGVASGTLALGIILGSLLVFIINKTRMKKSYDFDMQAMVTN